jgi:hypothetical protein
MIGNSRLRDCKKRFQRQSTTIGKFPLPLAEVESAQ